MPSPFDPIVIAGVELRNRFMRSATWDASATDDGEVTDTSVAIFEKLAAGGVGLISTGYAYVSEVGKAAVGQYGIAEDRHIAGLRRLVEAAHAGGARIAAQIGHGGNNLRLLGHSERVALCPSVSRGRHLAAARLYRRGDRSDDRRFRRRCGSGPQSRLRRRPAPFRARLPGQPVSLAAVEPSHGRMGRLA